jgi:hypothetical protein
MMCYEQKLILDLQAAWCESRVSFRLTSQKPKAKTFALVTQRLKLIIIRSRPTVD